MQLHDGYVNVGKFHNFKNIKTKVNHCKEALVTWIGQCEI